MVKNENGFQRSVDNEFLQDLPLRSFEGRIHLVDAAHQFPAVKNLIQPCTEFGFDTETRPTFRKGKVNRVALLQLACNDQAFVFRINRTGIPDFVKNILEDPSIIKVGVAIHDDLKSLNRIRPFKPGGFIDLQKYVSQFSIEDKGLKKLTANVLGFRISKRYQTSNWEEEELTQPQLEYAATDAWVCYEIYRCLRQNLNAVTASANE
jgi:ribonuclease D